MQIESDKREQQAEFQNSVELYFQGKTDVSLESLRQIFKNQFAYNVGETSRGINHACPKEEKCECYPLGLLLVNIIEKSGNAHNLTNLMKEFYPFFPFGVNNPLFLSALEMLIKQKEYEKARQLIELRINKAPSDMANNKFWSFLKMIYLIEVLPFLVNEDKVKEEVNKLKDENMKKLPNVLMKSAMR
jgi:hypothetical protein